MIPPISLLHKICDRLVHTSSLTDVEEGTIQHCLELWRHLDPEDQWADDKRDSCNDLIWSGHYHNIDTKLSRSLALNKKERLAMVELIYRKFLNTTSGYCHVPPLSKKRKCIAVRSPLQCRFDTWCTHLVTQIAKDPQQFIQAKDCKQIIATEESLCKQFSPLPTPILLDSLTYLAQHKHLVGVIILIRNCRLYPSHWITIVVQHFTPIQIQTIFRNMPHLGPREQEIISWDMTPPDLIVSYVNCLYSQDCMRYAKLLARLDFRRLCRLVYKFNHPVTPEVIVSILKHRDTIVPVMKQRIWHLVSWSLSVTPLYSLQDLLTMNLQAPWSDWDIELLHLLRFHIATPVSIDAIAYVMNSNLLPWFVHRWNPTIETSQDPLLTDCLNHFHQYVEHRRSTIRTCLKDVSTHAVGTICSHLF